ncbi:thyrotroph embryonic factor-like [Uloborus diversus]|uniref:thyrotroph embryonic factor-like n=1 Tax=Uloborus diversus TaxID=327109 RepID=UPI0024098C23|nr:thyrotroph embryonic factor-like [Uloborus diversus]
MDDFKMDSDFLGSVTIRSILANKDLANPIRAAPVGKDDKESEADIYADATAAFLGPNIWDKMSDFKMDYLDLDAILNSSPDQPKAEECVDGNTEEKVLHIQELTGPEQDGKNLCLSAILSGQISEPSSPESSEVSEHRSEMTLRNKRRYSVEYKFSPTDLALATPPGEEHYDPACSVLPDEQLKPQPIIKKSRKNFVPDNMKDDRYWARRHKNNMAARRSREARRLKENQIVLRASYLEKENTSLKEDVMRLKAENDMLKNQLKEYQS